MDGSLVTTHVDVLLLLDQLDEVVDDSLVEVLASQMRVSVCCDDFEDAVIDGEDGDIKSTTAQIEDEDILLPLLFI